ncbi:MAG: response regulator [Verrucomicrobiota bacterium]
MAEGVRSEEPVNHLVTDGEAISLLAHELSNSLMVIQSQLDVLRSRIGTEPAFEEIHKACTRSAAVLRGAIALLGNHKTTKEPVHLGKFLEEIFVQLQENAHHTLGLRTNKECCVLASRHGICLCLVQLVKNFQFATVGDEIYIEVFESEYEESNFGVIRLSGPGQMTIDTGLWNMLEALINLQGGILTHEDTDGILKIYVMFPTFEVHQAVFSQRDSAEACSALIVEDNEDVAELVSMHIQALGIPEVHISPSPYDAMKWLNTHTPGLVITDYSMRGMNGIEFLQKAQSALASSTVAIMSGIPLDDFQKELNTLMISVQVLLKPLKGDDIMRLVMESMTNGQNSNAPVPEEDLASFGETMRIPKIQKKP